MLTNGCIIQFSSTLKSDLGGTLLLRCQFVLFTFHFSTAGAFIHSIHCTFIASFSVYVNSPTSLLALMSYFWHSLTLKSVRSSNWGTCRGKRYAEPSKTSSVITQITGLGWILCQVFLQASVLWHVIKQIIWLVLVFAPTLYEYTEKLVS